MFTITDRWGYLLQAEPHDWEGKENWVSIFATSYNLDGDTVEIELSPDQVRELIAYLQSTQEA